VLNLGADKQFKHAMHHVTGVVQTIAESNRTADVLVATTRSRARIAALLDHPIGLLHVMGHGDPSGEIHAGHRLLRMPKIYTVEELRGWADAYGHPLRIDGLLLDACHTYSAEWRAGVASVIALRRPIVFIGTTRPVGWDEASTYVGAFYATLLRQLSRPARAPTRGLP
jgi:hypothetical protein